MRRVVRPVAPAGVCELGSAEGYLGQSPVPQLYGAHSLFLLPICLRRIKSGKSVRELPNRLALRLSLPMGSVTTGPDTCVGSQGEGLPGGPSRGTGRRAARL